MATKQTQLSVVNAMSMLTGNGAGRLGYGIYGAELGVGVGRMPNSSANEIIRSKHGRENTALVFQK